MFEGYSKANTRYKTNDLVNKFSVAGGKFMPQMHLIQPIALGKPGLTYSACDPFTKNIAKIQKFKDKEENHNIFMKMN